MNNPCRSNYDYTFLPLQYAVDMAIIQSHANYEHTIPVKLKVSKNKKRIIIYNASMCA